MYQDLGRRNAPLGLAVRALMVAGVLLTGAACSSNPPAPSGTPTPTVTATTATVSAAYCDDLQALDGNVAQLRALNPNTATAAQVQTIIVDAQNNLGKAAQDASGVAKAKITGVQAAYSALVAAFRALPTNVSGTQAFQQVQPQITALVAALDAARAGTDCPSPTAS
jgi:hypothetical protein